MVDMLIHHYSWCSFSMRDIWANDGLLQANAGKMLVNDGEMLVNDGEMSVWSYTHFTIINVHFTIIDEHFTIISLKYTIIRSFDHHGEAAPTALEDLSGAQDRLPPAMATNTCLPGHFMTDMLPSMHTNMNLPGPLRVDMLSAMGMDTSTLLMNFKKILYFLWSSGYFIFMILTSIYFFNKPKNKKKIWTAPLNFLKKCEYQI